MTSRGWLYLIVFLILIGLYFYSQDLAPKSYLDKKLKSMITVDKNYLDFSNKNSLSVNVKYKVTNNSKVKYTADNYFYQLILSRGYNAPGFVLHEFSHDLLPGETFEDDYNWKVDHPLAYGGAFRLYFNTYKIRPFEDPLLINSAVTDIEMQKIPDPTN